MDAITAIKTRVSHSRLGGDALPVSVIEELIRCALRAPDHAYLRPTRFIHVDGVHRETIGKVYLESVARTEDLSVERRNKLAGMLLRAPTILFVVSSVQEHPKVPRDEQVMSSAAAIQSLLIAAHAMGYCSIWRTGDMAYNQDVKDVLCLNAMESIVGIIYIGDRVADDKNVQLLDVDDYLTRFDQVSIRS